MKVCKACGTLYNEKEGPCPKCYSDDLMRSGEAAQNEIRTDMSAEEAEKAKKHKNGIIKNIIFFIFKL